MSTLTKQQWDQVKTTLMHVGNTVTLDCDGYTVALRLAQSSHFKNAIRVYVDGYIKGIWVLIEKNTEEGRRFFPTIRKPLHSQKQKKELIACLGKREAKKFPGFNEVMEFRKLEWSSFSALKKHFIANNESIKLVKNNE